MQDLTAGGSSMRGSNNGDDTAKTPVFRAAVATFVGLSVSLLVSLLVVAGLAMRFPPAVAVERAGVDLGMRIEAFAEPGATGTNTNAAPFAFFDVTLEACKLFSGDQELACR